MRPRHSDIFEAYAKLAEEKGIVKSAAEDKKDNKDKESSELKSYKSDVYARVGSDDISTIEALYGVKPDSIIEYENNIAEYAHPTPVVVAPSYDKLNALVENINERQKIIINKIRSTIPSGGADMFLKDAHKELTMELIRIGNDMDNADENELRLLADECLEGLQKKADLLSDIGDYGRKAVNYFAGSKGDKALSDVGGVGEGVAAGAATGALVGVVLTSWGGPLSLAGAGIGGLLGGIAGGLEAYIFNTSPKVKNIKENAADLLDQMGDLKKAVPEQADYFATVEEFMDKFVRASDNYIWMLNNVQQKTMKNETVLPTETQEVKNDAKVFVDMIETFEKIQKTFEEKVKLGVFAKALKFISVPGIANDIQDVSSSFKSLAVAVESLKGTMTGIVNKAVSAPKADETPAPDAKKEAPRADGKPSDSSLSKVWELLGRKPDEKTMNFLNSLSDIGKK